MKHLVLGYLGQVGSAIKTVLLEAGEEVGGIDIDQQENSNGSFDVIHVCYPDSALFDRITVTYLNNHARVGTLCIVHSSLVPGRIQKIIDIFPPTVYSPVRGKHPDLVHDLFRYIKYYASSDPCLLRRTGKIFDKMKLSSKGWLVDPVNLEHAKIINLNLFAMNVVFAQQLARLIEEKKLDRELIVSFIESTGDRSVLPYAQTIGGHCVYWGLAVASDYLPIAHELRLLNDGFAARYGDQKLFLKQGD